MKTTKQTVSATEIINYAVHNREIVEVDFNEQLVEEMLATLDRQVETWGDERGDCYTYEYAEGRSDLAEIRGWIDQTPFRIEVRKMPQFDLAAS